MNIIVGDFKFFKGNNIGDIPQEVQPEVVRQTIRGILNGNVQGVDITPYQRILNRQIYSSEIMDMSRNEWDEVRVDNPQFVYHLYAIFKPSTRHSPPSVIEFHGARDSFPTFVTNNPNIRYTFEFIKVPNTI
jgi:hypothetical protein